MYKLTDKQIELIEHSLRERGVSAVEVKIEHGEIVVVSIHRRKLD